MVEKNEIELDYLGMAEHDYNHVLEHINSARVLSHELNVYFNNFYRLWNNPKIKVSDSEYYNHFFKSDKYKEFKRELLKTLLEKEVARDDELWSSVRDMIIFSDEKELSNYLHSYLEHSYMKYHIDYNNVINFMREDTHIINFNFKGMKLKLLIT